MYLQRKTHRITVADIINRKGGDPIVSLTSYHAYTAAIVDKYADVILVGDSPGMVTSGMGSTIGIMLDLIVSHGEAVVSGIQINWKDRVSFFEIRSDIPRILDLSKRFVAPKARQFDQTLPTVNGTEAFPTNGLPINPKG